MSEWLRGEVLGCCAPEWARADSWGDKGVWFRTRDALSGWFRGEASCAAHTMRARASPSGRSAEAIGRSRFIYTLIAEFVELCGASEMSRASGRWNEGEQGRADDARVLCTRSREVDTYTY